MGLHPMRKTHARTELRHFRGFICAICGYSNRLFQVHSPARRAHRNFAGADRGFARNSSAPGRSTSSLISE